MYTTYHSQSAEDITADIVNIIKAAFKANPIKLTVEEDMDETAFLLYNPANREILMASIEQDKSGEAIAVTIPAL